MNKNYYNNQLAQHLEWLEALFNISYIKSRQNTSIEYDGNWQYLSGAFVIFDGKHSDLSRSLGLGLFRNVSEQNMQDIEYFFFKNQASVIQEIASIAEKKLISKLNCRKYELLDTTYILCCNIGAFNPSYTRSNLKNIRLIDNTESLTWAQTSAAGWSTEAWDLNDVFFQYGIACTKTPGVTSFLVEIDEQLAGSGSIFIHNDLALLVNVSILPEFRNQGAHLQLIADRLTFAKKKGCKFAMMVVLPESQSQRNAERLGFQIAYTRNRWLLSKI